MCWWFAQDMWLRFLREMWSDLHGWCGTGFLRKCSSDFLGRCVPIFLGNVVQFFGKCGSMTSGNVHRCPRELWSDFLQSGIWDSECAAEFFEYRLISGCHAFLDYFGTPEYFECPIFSRCPVFLKFLGTPIFFECPLFSGCHVLPEFLGTSKFCECPFFLDVTPFPNSSVAPDFRMPSFSGIPRYPRMFRMFVFFLDVLFCSIHRFSWRFRFSLNSLRNQHL